MKPLSPKEIQRLWQSNPASLTYFDRLARDDAMAGDATPRHTATDFDGKTGNTVASPAITNNVMEATATAGSVEGVPHTTSSPLEVLAALQRDWVTYAHLNPLKPTPTPLSPLDFSLGDSPPPLSLLPPKVVDWEGVFALFQGGLALEAQHLCEAERTFLYTHETLSESLSQETQTFLWRALMQAEELEGFLSRRFPGLKRFSLEGSEGLLSLLASLVPALCEKGIRRCCLAMAHRGRLNVLVNLLGKPVEKLCDEFMDKEEESFLMGDVKYHKGYRNVLMSDEGGLEMTLLSNPSHLSVITPVALGAARALGRGSIAVCVHGDGAFSGQGIIMESLQMSKLPAHNSGGSLHIILDNQILFTLEGGAESRSTKEASDLAKGFDLPVLHVNGDSPDAAHRAVRLSLAYRERFQKSVVIRLCTFRRGGHSEVDEPSLTSPLLMQKVLKKPSIAASYALKSARRESLVLAERERYAAALEAGGTLSLFDTLPLYPPEPFLLPKGAPLEDEVREVGAALTYLPKGFTPHRLLSRVLSAREEMFSGERELDFGTAELLAYGVLALRGVSVRKIGEDSRRGTFSHLHSDAIDQQSGARHDFLSRLEGRVAIYNSLLSEAGVLGFEYGHALMSQGHLGVWEAQFGDFANMAQVYFDQFIASSFEKWGESAPLVCLLPHGLEGWGPDHSSARIERFLQLATPHNLRIYQPTRASQLFHALFCACLPPFRPSIIFTPKSLLRHEAASSPLCDFQTEEGFVPLYVTPNYLRTATRLLLCSGKIYHSLRQRQRFELGAAPLVLAALEQLSPFPSAALSQLIASMPKLGELVYVQEEPCNQGAFPHYLQTHLPPFLRESGIALSLVSRPRSASPAVGSHKLHLEEEERLLRAAFHPEESSIFYQRLE